MNGRRMLRGGFAMGEAVGVVAVSCVLIALLAVAGGESRRQGRLGDDIANLRRIAEWTWNYAADNSDQFWTFSWKKGYSQSKYPDLNSQAQLGDLDAAAAQAVDILRRRAGREDIAPIPAWVPHIAYSHLTLLDHASAPMPELAFVSAMDQHRLAWARNPGGFDAGLYQPAPTSGSGPGTNSGKRWPYSSSFQLPTSFFDWSPFMSRITPFQTHAFYLVPTLVQLSARTHAEAAFPSQKVFIHDGHARHFGTVMPYCTHDQARLPMLFVDGSVCVRGAAESNPGWIPIQPSSSAASSFLYAPDAWEPPTVSGSATDPVIGRFRWTRGSSTDHGIVGRDFGGPETCSGQPGCP